MAFCWFYIETFFAIFRVDNDGKTSKLQMQEMW